MIQHAFIFAPGHGVYWMIGILLFIVIYKWRNILNALFYILVFPFVLPYIIIHDVVISIKRRRKKRRSEIRTDKLKSVATDVATALASGVSSLFGSGKMKSLERKNENLRDEIAIRDETIEQLQSNIKQMQIEHSRAMMNKDNEHRKALEAKEAEHKEETNILNSIINTAHRWCPDLATS